VLSWFYVLTPEGVALEQDVDHAQPVRHLTGRRLAFIVISMLTAAVALFAIDKWWLPAPPHALLPLACPHQR